MLECFPVSLVKRKKTKKKFALQLYYCSHEYSRLKKAQKVPCNECVRERARKRERERERVSE